MRLFVAAWPDDTIRARLSELDLESAKNLRLIGRSRWHVTLRFIGEVGDADVPRFGDAVATAALGVQGPVTCRIGPATAWFGRAWVLQLPVVGLEEVADRVRESTAPLFSAGIGDEPPFNGHLTLARARGRRLGERAQAEWAGIPFEGTFEVAHIDLVRSEPTPHGHRYTTVARGPFGG